jgi:hypothetical protein
MSDLSRLLTGNSSRLVFVAVLIVLCLLAVLLAAHPAFASISGD